MLINHLGGFGGHKEGVRGGGSGWGGAGSKVLMVCNLESTPLSSAVGGFKRECSPSPEVAGVASRWASQESCPDHEVVRRVVVHVPYPNNYEATPVRPDDVISYQADDVSLSELCPCL